MSAPTGGAGGAGGGYNIPISVSRAETTSLNPNQIAGSQINFGSGDMHGGWYDQTNEPYQPATAVSSASQRDAQSNLGGIGLPAASGINPATLYVVAGVGIVAVVAAIYFARK